MNTVQQYIERPIWISFEQKNKAKKIIQQRTLYAASIGLLPIPILDALSVTGIQIWMIKDIAKLYNVPFKEHAVKSLIAVVVGNLGSIGILKFIPILGISLGGSAFSISAASATYALGRVFLQHFDQGGTLLDFNPSTSRAFFLELYHKNKQVLQKMKTEESQTLVELKNTNNRLLEEEKLHEELHQEAERFIIELKQTLREQEAHYSKKQNQQDQAIQVLENSIRLLKE